MNQAEQQHTADEVQQRSINDKIARLRTRLKDPSKQATPVTNMRAVLLGILDLLGDEL